MDRLDPAHALIVEAFSTLEDATEALMPGQAPNSSADEIVAGITVLHAIADKLIKYAEQLASAVEASTP